MTLWEANYAVYGVRKLWKSACQAGHDIGRDQTGRLLRSAGIVGATRSKPVKTTRPDPLSARHPGLVRREFTATPPSRLWVADLIIVPTWAGGAYVCFIIDVYSKMIVGWRCASNMRAEMVLDAIEMARRGRGAHHDDPRGHSYARSQFTSIRSGERLAEIDATLSIGTVGDGYDDALA
jgi:transposase InsO family protein